MPGSRARDRGVWARAGGPGSDGGGSSCPTQRRPMAGGGRVLPGPGLDRSAGPLGRPAHGREVADAPLFSAPTPVRVQGRFYEKGFIHLTEGGEEGQALAYHGARKPSWGAHLEKLTTDESDTSLVPHPDGAGGVEWGEDANDGGGAGMRVPVVRVYGTSGSPHTWTKPAGLVAAMVEVVGGGGAYCRSTGRRERAPSTCASSCAASGGHRGSRWLHRGSLLRPFGLGARRGGFGPSRQPVPLAAASIAAERAPHSGTPRINSPLTTSVGVLSTPSAAASVASASTAFW